MQDSCCMLWGKGYCLGLCNTQFCICFLFVFPIFVTLQVLLSIPKYINYFHLATVKFRQHFPLCTLTTCLSQSIPHWVHPVFPSGHCRINICFLTHPLSCSQHSLQGVHHHAQLWRYHFTVEVGPDTVEVLIAHILFCNPTSSSNWGRHKTKQVLVTQAWDHKKSSDLYLDLIYHYTLFLSSCSSQPIHFSSPVILWLISPAFVLTIFHSSLFLASRYIFGLFSIVDLEFYTHCDTCFTLLEKKK